jgi:hypothetical protein
MFGLFLILVGLLLIGVAIYYVLFVHDKGASDPSKIIDAQQDKVDTNAGVAENYFKGRKVQSQTRFQEAVTENKRATTETIHQEAAAVSATLEKEAVPERHERKTKKEKADTEVYLAQKLTEQKEHQLRERLIDLALAQGFDVDTYIKQKLDELEIEKLERETMVKLKGGFVYQLQDYQKLTMLRSQLDELYEREHSIESGNEPDSVKQKKLAQVKADIELLEKDADGRRQGLLSANHGEETGRSNPDSEP